MDSKDKYKVGDKFFVIDSDFGKTEGWYGFCKGGFFEIIKINEDRITGSEIKSIDKRDLNSLPIRTCHLFHINRFIKYDKVSKLMRKLYNAKD